MPLGNLTDVVRGPFRVLVSEAPVQSLADLHGLKMRMYPDQLATAVWNNLGAETRLLGWTETYESIKSGVVEGVTSPVALVAPCGSTRSRRTSCAPTSSGRRSPT